MMNLPEDELGLLNFAKLYIRQNSLERNVTDHADVAAKLPSQYSTIVIVILTIVMIIIMVGVVIGNVFVILAVAMDNSLSSVQNWLIASLALADLSLGLVIMPFSLANQVTFLGWDS